MRGILHAHSRYSYDGTLTLEELRRLLVAHDLQFARMTEHTDHLSRRDAERFIMNCRTVSDRQFVFVPGFEVPCLDNHVLVIGTDRYYEGETALEQWARDGALLIQAHPQRNGYRTDAFLKEHLDGVEVWNSQYDGIHAPRRRSLQFLKTFNNPDLKAYGALDLHRATHTNGPRLELDAQPTERDIITTLRRGSFTVVRGDTVLNSRGALVSGGSVRMAVLGTVMPSLIALLRFGSSLLHHIGIRSFPFKRWLRSRV